LPPDVMFKAKMHQIYNKHDRKQSIGLLIMKR